MASSLTEARNTPINNVITSTTYERLFGPPPGQYLSTTKYGCTHYMLQGPSHGPLVILQHGLGSNLQVWNAIAHDLVGTQGFRVLRYDFYDRGYSETDPERYPITKVGCHPLHFTLEMHVEQMREVLVALRLESTDLVHVGHSTGGVVGMAYANQYPNHVKGLVLVDVVCLPASKPWTARLADVPMLGDWLVYFAGVSTLVKFARASCYDPDGNTVVRHMLDALARNARGNPRYFAAIRSTNTHCLGFAGSAEHVFRELCEKKSDNNNFAIHFIWGKADQSVPYADCLKLQKIAKQILGEGNNVTETSFDEMPHNVFFPDAKPDECAASIRKFVARMFS